MPWRALTGIKINHMIVVDLGNFVKFIDDIGGVTVNTPRICSKISGGAADGGYTLNLRAGSHHLTGDTGDDARTHARQLLQPRLHRHQPREDAAGDHERDQEPAVLGPRVHPPALGVVGRTQRGPDRHGRPDADAAVRRLRDRRLVTGAHPEGDRQLYNGAGRADTEPGRCAVARSSSC